MQCSQCCCTVYWGKQYAQVLWMGGLLFFLIIIIIPSGRRVSYFMASRTDTLCMWLTPGLHCVCADAFWKPLPSCICSRYQVFKFSALEFSPSKVWWRPEKRGQTRACCWSQTIRSACSGHSFPCAPQMWTVTGLWVKCIVLSVGSGHLSWKLFNPFSQHAFKYGSLYDGREATSLRNKMVLGSRLPAPAQSSGVQLRFAGEEAKGNKLDGLSCRTACGLWAVGCSFLIFAYNHNEH